MFVNDIKMFREKTGCSLMESKAAMDKGVVLLKRLLIGGSPCFKGDTLVYTDKGYKEIKDIVVGDKVLTHKNRFKKVTEIGNKESDVTLLKA